jgi:microcystin degradation protein MlrC
MRVAIAAFMHESNTFATQRTDVAQFEDAHLDYGAEIVAAWQDAHHEIGGMLEGCATEGLEAVPVMTAWATPSGPVTTEAYETLVTDLVAKVRMEKPLDGVLLALHGAMVAESFSSADTETLRRLRTALGPDVPIVLCLDMHANVTPEMVTHATATVIYRSYPHVDQRARGRECARIMARILFEGAKPRVAFRKLPLLIHIVQQYTGAPPLADIYAEVDRIAALPGMLTASVAPGYIYADVPHMGVSVVCVADGDEALAARHADALADKLFDRRDELNAALPDIPTAVREAAETPGTVCLMDCGDNIGGGGPGDSTLILAEVLGQGIPKACAVLYDPKAVAHCFQAGLQASVALEVGAKTDNLHGAPIPVRGNVRHLSEGRFEETEARHGGERFLDQGRTAVIETDDGHTIALNSLRVMPTSLQQLLSLDIDPKAHRCIIIKGVTAPRAAYDPIADRVITIDSPGVTQAGPESFGYHARPTPLFPLEEVSDWRKAPPKG